MICIASGTSESKEGMYNLLKRTAANNPSKRILILDFVTDSNIDMDFKLTSVKSPIKWLTGSESFKDFVVSSGVFNNVRVVTTALAYLNDVYLLDVDWVEKLAEIDKYPCDTIFVNVGCLNNLVSRLLFNTFSKYMRSVIVVKATPINLRSALFTFTTFKNFSENVDVVCVDFARSSEPMYKNLVSHFPKQRISIYKPTDSLVV